MTIRLTNNPALYTSGQIKEICKPIYNLFNVTFFRYLRIYPDGSRIHLCSNPLWTEHFYTQHFYNIAWFDANKLDAPKNMEILWDERAVHDDNIVGIQARNHFNIHHGISIIRPGFNSYEVYDFATARNNYKINEKYLANLDLFEHFLFYFRDKASSMIKAAEEIPLRPDDLIKKWRTKDNRDDRVIDDFLSQTKTKRYFINTLRGDIYLTRQEVKCIYWNVIGKSADEISMILGSSKRTVETHLDHVKQKLGCGKMSRAIKLVLDSGLLDVFKVNLD